MRPHRMKNERVLDAKYQTGISIKSQEKNRSTSHKTPVRVEMFSFNVFSPSLCVVPSVETAGGGIYVMLCQISDIGVVIFPPPTPQSSLAHLSRSEPLIVRAEHIYDVWDVSSKAVTKVMMEHKLNFMWR